MLLAAHLPCDAWRVAGLPQEAYTTDYEKVYKLLDRHMLHSKSLFSANQVRALHDGRCQHGIHFSDHLSYYSQ